MFSLIAPMRTIWSWTRFLRSGGGCLLANSLPLRLSFEEIVLKAEQDEVALDRRLARRVLKSLVAPWGFRAMSFIPVGRGIVAEIARRLRRNGIIPRAR